MTSTCTGSESLSLPSRRTLRTTGRGVSALVSGEALEALPLEGELGLDPAPAAAPAPAPAPASASDPTPAPVVTAMDGVELGVKDGWATADTRANHGYLAATTNCSLAGANPGCCTMLYSAVRATTTSRSSRSYGPVRDWTSG